MCHCQQKFLPEYIFAEIPAPVWKSIFVLPEVMTERWRGKSISGRTGAIFGQARKRNVERWNLFLVVFRSVGRWYSWIIWCRKNALFSTSSRAWEDLWLRRELASIECTATLLKWRRVFAASLYVTVKITERSESRLLLQNKVEKKEQTYIIYYYFYINIKFIYFIYTLSGN